MSRKTSSASLNSGRVEDDAIAHEVQPPSDGGVIESSAVVEDPHVTSPTVGPIVILPDTASIFSPADVRQLRDDYELLNVEVSEAAKGVKIYEVELLADVKLKVQARFGDVEAMKERKRQAYVAWETAHLAASTPQPQEAFP